MNSELQMVKDFHEKYDNDIDVSLPEHVNSELRMIADRLISLAVQLEARLPTTSDPRILRAQLMVEELGETLDAMAEGNDVLFLDGLTDLLYVVLGTAIAFDLPIVNAFVEVHRSNMTKEQSGDQRVRIRGKGFQQPDLARVLGVYRYEGRKP